MKLDAVGDVGYTFIKITILERSTQSHLVQFSIISAAGSKCALVAAGSRRKAKQWSDVSIAQSVEIAADGPAIPSRPGLCPPELNVTHKGKPIRHDQESTLVAVADEIEKSLVEGRHEAEVFEEVGEIALRRHEGVELLQGWQVGICLPVLFCCCRCVAANFQQTRRDATICCVIATNDIKNRGHESVLVMFPGRTEQGLEALLHDQPAKTIRRRGENPAVQYGFAVDAEVVQRDQHRRVENMRRFLWRNRSCNAFSELRQGDLQVREASPAIVFVPVLMKVQSGHGQH